jgi:hypothetical protein
MDLECPNWPSGAAVVGTSFRPQFDFFTRWKKSCCRKRGWAIRLINTNNFQSTIHLENHLGAVLCLGFSSDGQQLVSGSWDETIRLWNISNGEEIFCGRGHTDRVWRVWFSEDGKTIHSASADGTVKTWHRQTGELITGMDGEKAQDLLKKNFAEPPIRIVSQKMETVFFESATGKILGHWPVQLSEICSHPTKNIWAGAVLNHLILISMVRLD